MKKICFFSGDITRSGGTERVSCMIANGLFSLGRQEIVFLSLMEQEKETFFLLTRGIRHYALGKKWINPGPGYLKVIPKLRRFLKEQKIDIIIDIDIVLDALSIPAAKGLPVKIISWEHFNYDYEMNSFYRKMILKYSVKRTDYVVTLTEGDKNAYQKYLNRKEYISAVYNPMQDVLIGKTVEKERWLISVGGLIHRKGMDFLVQVAAVVLKECPDWKWILVGDGNEREYLCRMMEEYGLEDQLILAGQVQDVNAYLKKAEIFVMTSRAEGLPMALTEAKSFGLPGVGFDISSGLHEVILDGVNGYLIEPFDCEEMAGKLVYLMKNEGLRRQFSEHAQDGMEKFHLKCVLEKWEEILAGLE